MEENEAEEIAEVLKSDAKMFKQLVLKRSTKPKDPNKDAFCLTNLPKKALENVITEVSLKGDKAACQAIFEKISAEEVADQYRSQLQLNSQLVTRQRFFRQHEKNIEIEANAGI